MATRSRYQRGALERIKTKDGLCWYVRFSYRDAEGNSKRGQRLRIGFVRDYPTRKLALEAAADLRREANLGAVVAEAPRLFHEVVDRYLREELPPRYSTAKGYRNLLNNHIRPRWGGVPLTAVRAGAVRDWLRTIERSPKTVGSVRDMMRTLFRFAMLWEWIPESVNPMSLFRLELATKRTRQPRVLSVTEFLQLVDEIEQEPHRTMLLLTACLGLRCSELVGLQWRDVDWVRGTLRLQRSVVAGRIGRVKTEHSAKPLPLHPAVARLLQDHRKASVFTSDDDWIFASPHTAGEKPYLPDRIRHRFIVPAARKLGLGEGIGWHTLRHSYRAWLDQAGAPIGVQRDLLRHADVGTTMNVYGGSFLDTLREANGDIVQKVLQ